MSRSGPSAPASQPPGAGQRRHQDYPRHVARIYGDQIAQAMRIQYGGSVNSANIAEFIRQPEIDGALVGGASLKAPDFLGIVEQTAKIKKTG